MISCSYPSSEDGKLKVRQSVTVTGYWEGRLGFGLKIRTAQEQPQTWYVHRMEDVLFH